MSWHRTGGPRRAKKNPGESLVLGGAGSFAAGVGLVALAAVLAQGLLYQESDRQAMAQRMTEERLRTFVEEHSWLDYTTTGGETLAGLATRLRVGDADRIRQDNPKLLAKVADDEALEAGLELRVYYNQLEAEDFLPGEE